MLIKHQVMSLPLSHWPGSSFAQWDGQMTECDLEGPFPHESSIVLVIIQSSCNHCREMTYRNSQPWSRRKNPARTWGLEHFSFHPDEQFTSVRWPSSEGLPWFSVCSSISVFQTGSASSVLTRGFIYPFLMSLHCCDHFPMWSFKENKLDCKSQ